MSTSQTTRVMTVLGVVLPLGVAAVCFFYIPSTMWADAATGLVAALSLITGAILLRVMRAFPITDPDGFLDKTEIETLELALRSAMKTLVIAAMIAFATIVLLFLRPLLIGVETGYSMIDSLRGEAYSSAIGLLITFVFLRIVYAVRLDFSIISRQARAVNLSYDKRRAREAEEARRAAEGLDYSFKDDGDYPGRTGTTGH